MSTVAAARSRPVSLRTFLRMIAGAVLALGVTSALALVAITNMVSANTDTLATAARSTHAAQALQVALLVHNRESRLTELTGDPAHPERRKQAEAEISRWVATSAQLAGTAQERAIVDEIAERVARYVEERAKVRMESLPRAEQVKHTERLSATVDRVNDLIAHNLEESRRAHQQVGAWNRTANAAGSIAALLVFGGLAAVVWRLRAVVFLPLERLHDAIRDHRSGSSVRAPEIGPAELSDLAAEFNALTEALRHQEEQQLQFLAAVAHDFRNPIGALRLAVGRVRKKQAEGKLDEALGTSAIALIDRQIEGLNRMVDDFLDRTRLQSGQLELRCAPVDLREPVRGVLELFRAAAPDRSLNLEADGPVTVFADADRIEQVVTNLVSNAIKYSPQAAPVRISVGSSDTSGWVEVSDHGMGIEPQDLPHIFEPFRRTSASRASVPGVGLGLSAARMLAEAHGGSLEVASEPGRGSTFRLTLPRVDA